MAGCTSWPQRSLFNVQGSCKLMNELCEGLRPEQPRDCDTECWELMQRCWNGEPLKRPHVGELENCLRTIFDRFVAAQQANGDVFDSDNNADLATNDSDGFFEVDYDDLTLKWPRLLPNNELFHLACILLLLFSDLDLNAKRFRFSSSC